MTPEDLQTLLRSVANGQLDPDQAIDHFKHFAYEPVGDFAKVDHHRSLRTGFPEAIWGQDKTPEQIAAIVRVMRDRNDVVMVTRLDAAAYAALKPKVPDLRYYPLARISALGRDLGAVKHPGTIALVSAGTSDLPVAEEAAVTAELCGFRVMRLWDVGVAGIHRLLDNRALLNQADVIVVAAGMEGALPSVVAGLVDCPVVAVPTSIGYGANFQGLAPLLTMLNSCAAGIGVVNIDNGFGAAILAGQILRTAARIASAPRDNGMP